MSLSGWVVRLQGRLQWVICRRGFIEERLPRSSPRATIKARRPLHTALAPTDIDGLFMEWVDTNQADKSAVGTINRPLRPFRQIAEKELHYP